jgi:hypothetical protein
MVYFCVLVSMIVAQENWRIILLVCNVIAFIRGSIDAQKQVDEYNRPNTYGHTYYLVEEGRPRAFNSFTCNNSFFKGRAGGAGSSFKTCRYYTDQARDRRDALMEKVEEEKA